MADLLIDAQSSPQLRGEANAAETDPSEQGRDAHSEIFYRDALSLAPDRSANWANLGLAVMRAGRAEDAVACQRQALRLDPTNVEALNNLGIAMHALNALPEAEN